MLAISVVTHERAESSRGDISSGDSEAGEGDSDHIKFYRSDYL